MPQPTRRVAGFASAEQLQGSPRVLRKDTINALFDDGLDHYVAKKGMLNPLIVKNPTAMI